MTKKENIIVIVFYNSKVVYDYHKRIKCSRDKSGKRGAQYVMLMDL